MAFAWQLQPSSQPAMQQSGVGKVRSLRSRRADKSLSSASGSKSLPSHLLGRTSAALRPTSGAAITLKSQSQGPNTVQLYIMYVEQAARAAKETCSSKPPAVQLVCTCSRRLDKVLARKSSLVLPIFD